MEKAPITQPPKVFLCEKCKVYFFSFSGLTKPTHTRCAGHKTRLATNDEIDWINKTNQMSVPHQ